MVDDKNQMNYNEKQQNKLYRGNDHDKKYDGLWPVRDSKRRKEIYSRDEGCKPPLPGCQYPYAEKALFFETAIRSYLKKYIQRGKVDIFVTYEDLSEGQMSLKYNEALASEYLDYFRQMEEKFGLENDVRISALSRYPEVFTMEEQDVDEEESGMA